jgi:hypothetical protein
MFVPEHHRGWIGGCAPDRRRLSRRSVRLPAHRWVSSEALAASARDQAPASVCLDAVRVAASRVIRMRLCAADVGVPSLTCRK